jgi:acetyl-CoA C-acetyltransferase
MHVGNAPRRVAIIGGARIPFARSMGAYAEASNQQMLTAALQALTDKYQLAGARLGDVGAGAVLKSPRDFNLTREAVLGTTLDAHTPAFDLQRACGTSLETAIVLGLKIAAGQIDSAIAAGVDTASDAPPVAQRAWTFARPAAGPVGVAAAGTLEAQLPRRLRTAHRAHHGAEHGTDGAPLGHHARGAGPARV